MNLIGFILIIIGFIALAIAFPPILIAYIIVGGIALLGLSE